MRRSGWYNLTVAGAAGGRGPCNLYYGRGAVLKVTAYLTAGQDAAILVGQKGTGHCSVNSSYKSCKEVPMNANESENCFGVSEEENLLSGTGGGGGGASLVVLLNETKLAGLPLVISGGGGGSGWPLYRVPATEFSNESLMSGSGKNGEVTGCDIFCIFRPGVGSGWNGNPSSLMSVDGHSFIMGDDFAEGGIPCCSGFEADGGFGGGGGGCIFGGGGGGGYTGGSVLGDLSGAPGESGTSFMANSSSGKKVILLDFHTNSDTSFVEIVPVDCGCTGSCMMYESDQFECVCPENSVLAPDQSDCYNGMFCSVVTDLDYQSSLQWLPFHTI